VTWLAMTAAEIAGRAWPDPAALRRAGATARRDSEGLSPARMIGAAVLVPIVLHRSRPCC
jgi:hypothetical protein